MAAEHISEQKLSRATVKNLRSVLNVPGITFEELLDDLVYLAVHDRARAIYGRSAKKRCVGLGISKLTGAASQGFAARLHAVLDMFYDGPGQDSFIDEMQCSGAAMLAESKAYLAQVLGERKA
jgi:hypothetical protein